MFAQNHWYVAAMSSEVTSQPLGRTVLGQPVALYRTETGQVAALRDRCPHRRYPLSLGTVHQDRLVCGYHGFCFDTAGRCVELPDGGRVPSRADVRSYPLLEYGPWIMIWMGDPRLAEPGAVPDMWWLKDPSWAMVSGTMTFSARYELFIDNLLDLSHETFVHPANIGTPEVARTPIEAEVDGRTGVVRVTRRMYAVTCPPFYANATGIQGPVDRFQDIEYIAPGFCLLLARIAPPGLAQAPDRSEPGAYYTNIVHAITPATATTTHDFWTVTRNFAVTDDEVSRFLEKTSIQIVEEDLRALEALETHIANDPDPFEVNVRNDRGGLFARRRLTATIVAEQNPPPSDQEIINSP